MLSAGRADDDLFSRYARSLQSKKQRSNTVAGGLPPRTGAPNTRRDSDGTNRSGRLVGFADPSAAVRKPSSVTAPRAPPQYLQFLQGDRWFSLFHDVYYTERLSDVRDLKQVELLKLDQTWRAQCQERVAVAAASLGTFADSLRSPSMQMMRSPAPSGSTTGFGTALHSEDEDFVFAHIVRILSDAAHPLAHVLSKFVNLFQASYHLHLSAPPLSTPAVAVPSPGSLYAGRHRSVSSSFSMLSRPDFDAVGNIAQSYSLRHSRTLTAMTPQQALPERARIVQPHAVQAPSPSRKAVVIAEQMLADAIRDVREFVERLTKVILAIFPETGARVSGSLLI